MHPPFSSTEISPCGTGERSRLRQAEQGTFFYALTKFGRAALAGGDYQSDMLPFEDSLTDEEIWAAIAFIKSQWPKAIRKRHAAMGAGHN